MRLDLAEAYLALEREEEARAAFAEIVALYPDHAAALNNLAWLSREKDLAEASAYAERAYHLAPRSPEVMDTLGVLLQRRGDKARGQRLIENAAELAPGDLDIQLHFAQILADQARTDEAKRVLKRVTQEGGDGPAAARARSMLQSLPSE